MYDPDGPTEENSITQLKQSKRAWHMEFKNKQMDYDTMILCWSI